MGKQQAKPSPFHQSP